MVVAAEELAAACEPRSASSSPSSPTRRTPASAPRRCSPRCPALGVRPDVAVVGEPTGLALAATLARVRRWSRSRSRAARRTRSQPELGVNAVAHLGRLVTAVEARSAAVRGRRRRRSWSPSPAAATPRSSLARSARALVERRTVPGEARADALAEVEACSTTCRARPDARRHRPARRRPRGLAARRRRSGGDPGRPGSEDASRTAPDRFDAPYWMEAPLWQAAGIPTLVCGPAGGGLHAADEWVDLRQVRALRRRPHRRASTAGRPPRAD